MRVLGSGSRSWWRYFCYMKVDWTIYYFPLFVRCFWLVEDSLVGWMVGESFLDGFRDLIDDVSRMVWLLVDILDFAVRFVVCMFRIRDSKWCLGSRQSSCCTRWQFRDRLPWRSRALATFFWFVRILVRWRSWIQRDRRLLILSQVLDVVLLAYLVLNVDTHKLTNLCPIVSANCDVISSLFCKLTVL